MRHISKFPIGETRNCQLTVCSRIFVITRKGEAYCSTECAHTAWKAQSLAAWHRNKGRYRPESAAIKYEAERYHKGRALAERYIELAAR